MKRAGGSTGWKNDWIVCFHANALLDFVEAGPGVHKVDQLLQAAALQQVTVFVSVMNLGEVFYWLWRKRSEQRARQTIDDFSRLPIHMAPVDLPQALKAGELKVLHKTALCGLHRRCSCLATSSHPRHYRPRF